MVFKGLHPPSLQILLIGVRQTPLLHFTNKETKGNTFDENYKLDSWGS